MKRNKHTHTRAPNATNTRYLFGAASKRQAKQKTARNKMWYSQQNTMQNKMLVGRFNEWQLNCSYRLKFYFDLTVIVCHATLLSYSILYSANRVTNSTLLAMCQKMRSISAIELFRFVLEHLESETSRWWCAWI